MRALASTPLVIALGLVLGTAFAADTAPLPAPVAAKVEAFRKVPWAERLRPERPEPAPDGWQARVEAEWALASLDASQARCLLPLLKDDDRFVRALAARSVGIAQPEGASAALIEAIAAEKDKLVRMSLVEAVARTGGAGALESVESLQVGGADPDVVHMVGLARRQLKGGRWDVDSIRGEHAEASRTKLASAKIGEPAPELALPSTAGVVNLSTLRGRFVLLVFAHGDRGNADMKAIARLQEASEKLAEWGVTVVVVDPHEKERTKIWADKLKLPYVFASDPSGRAQAAYGVARQLFAGGEWLPSPGWFVLDREGVLRWRKLGRRMDEQTSLGELLPVLDQVARNIKPQ